MSDQPNTTTDLATVENQLTDLATFDIDSIGAQLGAIYDEADQRGDIETVNRAGWLWDMAQQQNAALTTSRNAAATAVTIAKAVTAQRDAALNEYKSYTGAVEGLDTTHPVAGKTLSRIWNEASEEGFSSGLEVAHDELEDTIAQNIIDYFEEVESGDAIIFAGLLSHSYPMDEEFYSELASTITNLAATVRARLNLDKR